MIREDWLTSIVRELQVQVPDASTTPCTRTRLVHELLGRLPRAEDRSSSS